MHDLEGHETMQIARYAKASAAHLAAREELLRAEIALKEQRETVAALRRKLPSDPVADEYVFHEGPPSLDEDEPIRAVRLSELFETPSSPLVVYQLMYGGAQKKPCPMCSCWIDALDGIAHHARRRVNLAVIARAPIESIRSWARERSWHNIRLVSAADTTFKRDFAFENDAEEQMPGVSVFLRRDDGSVEHFYSATAPMDPDNPARGLDRLNPLWELFDLTPEGRGDFMPTLEDSRPPSRVGRAPAPIG